MEPEAADMFTVHEKCRLLLTHSRFADILLSAVHDLFKRNSGMGNEKSGEYGKGVLFLLSRFSSYAVVGFAP